MAPICLLPAQLLSKPLFLLFPELLLLFPELLLLFPELLLLFPELLLSFFPELLFLLPGTPIFVARNSYFCCPELGCLGTFIPFRNAKFELFHLISVTYKRSLVMCARIPDRSAFQLLSAKMVKTISCNTTLQYC